MTCQEYRAWLELSVDAKLRGGRLGAARDHVRRCGACSQAARRRAPNEAPEPGPASSAGASEVPAPGPWLVAPVLAAGAILRGRTLLSVFMAPAPGRATELPGMQVMYRGREYVIRPWNGYRTAAWQDGRMIVGLVGRLTYRTLLECAERLRRRPRGLGRNGVNSDAG